MAGDLLMGDLNTASFIEIEDAQRELIETVSFAEAVNVRDEAHDRNGRETPKLGDGPDRC